MEKISIKFRRTEDRSYEILIGNGILKNIPLDLKEANIAYTYAIITDSRVASLYGKEMLKEFLNSGLKTYLISFPEGEENKNRETKAKIEDEMLSLKMARDSAIVALGGGVVGDLAGFVAATYNRGIPYIQVPTTLVASVDSSIGGKTGVDTVYGKNLIGAFYQPWRVYIDVSTLKTLPKNHIQEGLSEVIKYGVIRDEELFEFLEKYINKVFSLDTEVITYIIKRSCQIKGEVVELDEKESNLRKILNFGHTVGHAIEKLYNFKISHGKAISIGMTIEGKIAVELGLWDKNELNRLISLLKAAGLPTKPTKTLDANDMIKTMKLDKKAREGKIEMVFPERIGQMATINGSYGIKVEDDLIYRILKET
ncbi:3-dehydroquinate synthase [bacterium HR37]|jgi:3-dehydroquinate synthase|nr:3-dehydroquinate synthase [bacterium HR37]